jgi:hypothetical protein
MNYISYSYKWPYIIKPLERWKEGGKEEQKKLRGKCSEGQCLKIAIEETPEKMTQTDPDIFKYGQEHLLGK